MFKTRVTEMLGIQYPIIQGGMAWVSSPELAAAVSNAGGLGIITSANCPSGKELRDDIRKTKSLTDKPFGVNISLFPASRPLSNDEYVQVVIEEGVRAVESSGFRSPQEYVERLKKANVKLIHKVATVRHAVTAERIGADAVAVVGFPNGGAMGPDDIATFVIIPMAVDSVKIPVIGGGGIGDARGLVAALALGAEAVVMGTRFMATKECPAHPKFKEWLVRAKETDTVAIERSVRNTHRTLRNKAAEKLLEMEARGASLEEMLTITGYEQTNKVMVEGDLEAGIGLCGQVVGLIHDIPTVKELIEGIVNEAMAIRERLNRPD